MLFLRKNDNLYVNSEVIKQLIWIFKRVTSTKYTSIAAKSKLIETLKCHNYMFLLILTVREFCGWSTRKEMSSSSNFMIWQATKSSLLKISENNITFYPSAGSSIRTSFSYRIIKMSNCSIWITTVSKICIPIRLQS